MCRNLASPAAIRAVFNTISSEHFEKVIIIPMTRELSQSLEEYDQIFYSFAKRLHGIGAVKPLTIVVVTVEAEGGPGELDFRGAWPLFSGLGEVVWVDD